MSREYRFTERHLSSPEIVCDILQTYGSNIVVHVGILHSDVQLTEWTFVKALTKLVEYQPALCMKITTEHRESGGIRKRFEQMGQFIPQPVIVQGTDRRSWVAMAEDEMKTGFESSEGPLWDMKYMEFTERKGSVSSEVEPVKTEYEGALFFKAHHVIVDNVSGFDLLFNQFIPILNSILSEERISPMFDTPLFMLPSPKESFSEKGANRKTLMKSLKIPQFCDETNTNANEFRPVLTHKSKTNISTLGSSSRILPFSLSRLITKIFFDRCKENNVSEDAALMTICNLSFGIVTNWEHLEIGEHMLCGYSVDLRQYRTIHGPQPLGMWMGYGVARMKRHTSYLSPKIFWEEVHRVDELLRADSKPWKTLAKYDSILKKMVKSQSVAPTAELTKVHFQIDDLGNCDKKIFEDVTTSRLMTPTSTPRGSMASSTLSIRNDSIYSRQTVQSSATSNGDAGYYNYCHERDIVNLGHFHMEEHYFTKSMSNVTNVPLVVSMCTYRGCLMSTVTYNGRWISRPLATKFIDLVLRIANDMVSNSTETVNMWWTDTSASKV